MCRICGVFDLQRGQLFGDPKTVDAYAMQIFLVRFFLKLALQRRSSFLVRKNMDTNIDSLEKVVPFKFSLPMLGIHS